MLKVLDVLVFVLSTFSVEVSKEIVPKVENIARFPGGQKMA